MTHRTAISRRALSAPARWLLEHGHLTGRILDYGCGKGDLSRFTDLDVTDYDPHFAPELPPKLARGGGFDVVYMGYVLNVLTSPAERSEAVRAASWHLATRGRLYASVRRDIPKSGTPTQAWVDPPGWMCLTENARFAIYRS